MEPYENQLIGAFLYAFGYAVAQQDASQDGSGQVMPVNLLQQTPLDTAFSDLIVGSERSLIIEFKRSEKEVVSEKEKWPAAALNALLEKEDVKFLSMQAHFLVYGARQQNNIDMRTCFYLDALGGVQPPVLNRCSAHALIDVILGKLQSSNSQLGATPDRLSAYMAILAKIRRTQDGRAGRRIAGGAWVGVAKKNGRFLFQSAESLELLLGQKRELAHEKRHDRDRDRGRDLERGFER